MRASTATAALILLAASGCEPFVHGDGVFAEEVRVVPAFDGVSIGLEMVATVRAGAGERSVVLGGDENVLPYIETRVIGGVLETGLDGIGGFESVHQMRLAIRTPSLVRIDASEGADVEASSVDAESFTVNAREGSRVTLAAAEAFTAKSLDLTADGSSTVDAVAYPVRDAVVVLSDGARAGVLATGTVTGGLSGGAILTVHGGGTCDVTIASGAVCQPAP